MDRNAATVRNYLADLPEDRRKALEAVRRVMRKNLGKGYEEGMQYGMIGYYVPHRVYPPGYHCDPKQPLPFASLASMKNHMSLGLMCLYADPDREAWFRKAWAKTGKKLDMGKACIRFKKLEDLPLDLIGETVARVPVAEYINHYESAVKPSAARRPGSASRRPSSRATSAAGQRRSPARKTAKKKAKKKK